ncbi:MAG: hypothetical protein ACTS6G_04550, partial [Candidatus Hodgkinia cicadicola]
LKNGNLSFGKWESRFPFKLKPFGGEADWAKDCFDVLSAQRRFREHARTCKPFFLSNAGRVT